MGCWPAEQAGGSGAAGIVAAADAAVVGDLSTGGSGYGAWQSRAGGTEQARQGDYCGDCVAGQNQLPGLQRLPLHRRADRSPRHRRLRFHRTTAVVDAWRGQRDPPTGMLLQRDGSPQEWLEGRGPWLTLHTLTMRRTKCPGWCSASRRTPSCCTAIARRTACLCPSMPTGTPSSRTRASRQ